MAVIHPYLLSADCDPAFQAKELSSCLRRVEGQNLIDVDLLLGFGCCQLCQTWTQPASVDTMVVVWIHKIATSWTLSAIWSAMRPISRSISLASRLTPQNAESQTGFPSLSVLKYREMIHTWGQCVRQPKTCNSPEAPTIRIAFINDGNVSWGLDQLPSVSQRLWVWGPTKSSWFLSFINPQQYLVGC